VALYAAYGSNMDPEQMRLRCPHSPQRGTGWLEGWRLTFGGEDIGWDGALPTVVEERGSRVFVVLYDVFETDEKELDNWDGVTLGYYRKAKVRAQTLDGDMLAWLYVLNFYEGGLPSARTIGILADAAEKAGAPTDYVAAMRALPCAKLGDATDRPEPPWTAPGPLRRGQRRLGRRPGLEGKARGALGGSRALGGLGSFSWSGGAQGSEQDHEDYDQRGDEERGEGGGIPGAAQWRKPAGSG
jgi:gamma-glutamylcyclotransferase (GGCT)/AIG2-like uncharacterized protein YtfP